MKRREFIALVGSALAWPIAARAQQAEKVFRVGLVLTTTPGSEMVGPDPIYPPTRAFVHALRDLGYIEGRNLVLERRTAEGRFERLSDIVAELIRLKVDVIVTGGNPPARAAKAMATTVPIVAIAVGDPVADGLVQSLARPGGNLTGLMIRVGSESEAKRLQLLKEMLPSVSRVGYLGSKENKDWEEPRGQSVRTAAQVLGMTLALAEHTPGQYADAFTVISRAQADALFVGPGPVAYADRALIVDFATRARLPSSFAFRESVELGGLMSYGVSVVDLFRRSATYVDKILKGAKPADLPVEQPTTFELVINLKVAKGLGLTVPPSLLARADEVIE
jgi:putative tryptophan/tyrosine transport system substrate-binding protein